MCGPAVKMCGARQVIGGNHAAELDEFVVPLAGIAERGDAMAELPERELRVVLDVKVQIDQARHDRAAGKVETFSVRRQRDPVGRTNLCHSIPVNHQAAVFSGAAPVPSMIRTLSSTSRRAWGVRPCRASGTAATVSKTVIGENNLRIGCRL